MNRRINNPNLLKITAPALILIALLFCSVKAQVSTPTPEEPPIKVSTVLLNVPVVVSGRDRQRIDGLKKEDFFVVQGKQRLEIDFFEDSEVPMNVALLIDTSTSTSASSLERMKKSAEFFLTTLKADDAGIIASFDYDMHWLTAVTSNRTKLRSGVERAYITTVPVEEAPRGNMGRLYDAIYRVITKEFANAKGRKAIVILSDGFELGTNISFEKLSNTLIDSDVVVYAALFPTAGTMAFFPPGTKSVTRDQFLKLPCIHEIDEMARITGGVVYMSALDDLNAAFQRIGDELRKQYTIGFYPITGTGESSAINIEVNRKDATVRTRKTIRAKTAQPPTSKN